MSSLNYFMNNIFSYSRNPKTIAKRKFIYAVLMECALCTFNNLFKYCIDIFEDILEFRKFIQGKNARL